MSHLQIPVRDLDPSQLQLAQIQLQLQQQQSQQYLQQQPQHETEENKYKRFFYNRSQADTEKAEEFLGELERLTRLARMDQEMPHSSLESIVRERFVLGLRDQQVQVIIMIFYN